MAAANTPSLEGLRHATLAQTRKSFIVRSFAALLVLVLACTLGCHEELQTVYGQRSGPGATESVNGTAVFAEMFETAGHHVSSWGALSPRLDQADCIVWFPDDFQPPGPDVVTWFEKWLTARPNRTLIYVGRDFDAVPCYWHKIEAAAPADQQEEIAEIRAEAERTFQALRKLPQPSLACRWFRIQYDADAGPPHNVTGDLDWLDQVDLSRLEIELHSRISPRANMEALLESDEGPIIGRLDISQRGQVLVVANGSFLLNAMLVNHEHRKLAGKLVDAIGPSGRDVVFLESGRITIDEPTGGGPLGPDPFTTGPGDGAGQRGSAGGDSGDGLPIRAEDPPPEAPNFWDLFLRWPTNWILLHFALIGILFCFWKLPIFGLPRPEEPAHASDFGRHIDAVAALLRRTADRSYALCVRHYQQVVKKVE